MAYDEGLAIRIEEALQDIPDVQPRKMFGGIAFMVKRHMCVGVIDDMLLARIGPINYKDCLQKEHVREMSFTGKPLTGIIYVLPEGISSDKDLKQWLDLSLNFIYSLPPKTM